MSNLPLIIDALDFASRAHRDQRRKDAEASPYISHPIALVRILVVEGGIEDAIVIAGALLHDTVEDCGVTFAELDARFGAEVTDVVRQVTDDKTLPKGRRKELQIEHAANLTVRAKLVKLADKIANVRDVGHTPPADWSLARRQDYADWAKRVVDGLRGINPVLETAFDKAHSFLKLAKSDAMDFQTIQAYRETHYVVHSDAPMTLQCDVFNPYLDKLHEDASVVSSAFITACNPFSQVTSDPTNIDRQARLAQELRDCGLTFIDGIGQHPSGNWPGELSFLVLGLSLEEAKNFGIRYEQNAIIWCGLDAVPQLVLL